MLYDILIIDDDFKLEKASQYNNLKSEEISQTNAIELFNNLIRENLRVTWTTGELEDLKKLRSKDLSAIRYIFLDLHLNLGFSQKSKSVTSDIIGILAELDKRFKKDKISILINSNFLKEEKEKKTINELKTAILKEYNGKYNIEEIETKNNLSDEQKIELRKNNTEALSKSLIIGKAIELEKVFNEALKLSSKAQERVNFGSKFYVFQSQFLKEDDEATKQKIKEIQLLQQIRNKLAHTDGELNKFEDFSQLIKYAQSIDKLIEKIKEMLRD